MFNQPGEASELASWVQLSMGTGDRPLGGGGRLASGLWSIASGGRSTATGYGSSLTAGAHAISSRPRPRERRT